MELLARFFEKEEYANQFLDGKLRMMSLHYYRTLENDGGIRKDKLEGTQKYWQGKYTTIKIGDTVIGPEDGLVNLALRLDDFENNTKICSFTCINYDVNNRNYTNL